jgi:SAM-dependent methyltransferase
MQDRDPMSRENSSDFAAERAKIETLFRERDERESRRPRYRSDQAAVRLEAQLIALCLRDWPLCAPGASILEIGCGKGAWLPHLTALSPRLLVGLDLLPTRLQIASRSLPESSGRGGGKTALAKPQLLAACASALPFARDCFDLVVLATVTSGIRSSALREQIVAETRRVLRPGGRVLHYDLRRADPRGAPWDPISPEAAAELFQMTLVRRRTLGLLPPLARALGPLAPALGSRLAAFESLHSHGLALLAEKEE